MKGKNKFTQLEINELIRLIELRNQTESKKQKPIRDKMRKLGFYGRDDWGIIDLQVNDLIDLIEKNRITVF
ncbi:MAG: Uncharacterized protein XD91_1576 [Clostridiales bacterium 38_11]|nr:MAG: Uncharacterized protein XD91_1576 [Clostridiales bacterium 38_11]